MKTILVLLLSLIPLFASLEKVSVRLVWKHQFEFAGFYVAKEFGFYEDVGLDVDILEYEKGIDITDEVLSRKVTYGVSSSQIIADRFHGKDIVLLASYFKQNALVIVTRDDIKNLNELKGKKIMLTEVEKAKASLLLMLEEFHLTLDDLDIVPHSFNIDDLVNGKVDGFSAFLTNQLFELDKINFKYKVFNPAEYGIYSYDEELFTSEIEANENPERAQKFIDATNKGWIYALEHKEDIVELIYNKYSKVKSKEALLYEAQKTDELFKRDIYEVGEVVPELLKLNAKVYSKYKEQKLDLNRFIFNIHSHIKPQINFTLEEQLFIQKKPIIKFSDVIWKPFADIDKNGSYSGIFRYYYDQIEKKTGLKFEFVQIGDGYNFQSVLNALRDKKIDMIDGTGYTSDRATYSLFVGPFMQLSLAIASNQEYNFNNLNALENKRVAVAKGSTAYEYIKENYPEINITETNGVSEALELISNKKVDAVVDNILVIDYLIKKLNLKNLNITGIADYEFKIYGLVRDDYPILRDILSKAIKSINTKPNSKEKQKFLNELNFTNEELNYLTQKEKVTMCIDPNWMPFEALKDGKHIGMSADYIDFIQSYIGIKIELIPTNSWSKSIKLAKNRICDILSLVMETDNRKTFLNFTKPYLEVPLVVATKNNVDFIADISILNGKKLSIPKDYAFLEIIKKRYPLIDILEVDNIEEALKSVRTGNAFGAIGTLLTVGYQFQKNYTGELKIAGKFDDKWKLGIGVRNDDLILLSILNKAISSISEEDKQKIFNRWISIKYEQGIDYMLVWKIIIFASIIFLIILYWNRKLVLLNRELKKTHIQLKLATQKANEATLSKSRFLANVSHEIRTPMNAIIGMSYLLLDSTIDSKEREYVIKIKEASNNLLRIINDILDFSKIEAGKMNLESVEFNLSKVIESVLNLLYIRMVDKKLDFVVNHHPTMPVELIGDPLRLLQILTNLISNSIKFTDKGQITLNIFQIDEARFRFEVIDTGIGISKEELNRLFVAFSQADDSTTRKYGGTGLGLVITKQLIELMGGEIYVQSELGIGSRFIFEVNIKVVKNSIQRDELVNIETKNIKKRDIDLREKLSDSQFKELLIELENGASKYRPKLCEPILLKIESFNLNSEHKEIFITIRNLITKYRFKEAIELIQSILK